MSRNNVKALLAYVTENPGRSSSDYFRHIEANHRSNTATTVRTAIAWGLVADKWRKGRQQHALYPGPNILVSGAAQILSCHRWHVLDLINRGQLTRVDTGGRAIVLKRRDVEAYRDKQLDSVTTREAARMLGWTIATVERRVQAGKLKAWRSSTATRAWMYVSRKQVEALRDA